MLLGAFLCQRCFDKVCRDHKQRVYEVDLQGRTNQMGILEENCNRLSLPHGEGWRGGQAGHLKINGTWYATKYKWADMILQLVRVDEVMKLSGSMDFPEPTYIKTFTEIFSYLKRWGVTEDRIAKFFPKEQIDRMRGKVLSNLIHGKKRRRRRKR